MSDSDEDPVVSVSLRKRRRASVIATVLHGRGDPEDDEASGEDSEGEAGGESDDDDVGAEGAHPPERVAQMRRVVESIELCVRNVGLSPDYVALAHSYGIESFRCDTLADLPAAAAVERPRSRESSPG